MKRSMAKTQKSTRSARRLLLGLGLAAFVGSVGSEVSAADCSCDTCKPVADCGCAAPQTKLRVRFNPVYDTLDSLAGGIEHVFGLDRCKQNCGCDELACDAMPNCGCGVNASPTPMMPPHALSPMPSATQTTPRMQPRLPSVPSLDSYPSEPRMVSPIERSVDGTPADEPPANGLRDPMPGTETIPQSTTPPVTEPGVNDPSESSPNMTMPRIVPGETPPAGVEDVQTQPLPVPADTPKDDGSIFDELNDPFMEDARRLRKPYQPIRPTGLRPMNSGQAPSRSRLPRSTRSVQPASQKVIGSGLRLAPASAPLRPVSHEEPVALQPLGGGRVLAPYRRSR